MVRAVMSLGALVKKEHLTQWRQAMGHISQDEAADRIGRSRRQWQRWEAGESPLPFWLPFVLAAVYCRIPPWPKTRED